MNIFTVPLAPATPQIFTVPLSGIRYTLKLRWNPVIETWILDVSDNAGNALANGIAVVAGADLVNQLTYLGFPGALLAQSGTDPNQPPSLAGLGVTDHLFYVPYGQVNQARFVR